MGRQQRIVHEGECCHETGRGIQREEFVRTGEHKVRSISPRNRPFGWGPAKSVFLPVFALCLAVAYADENAALDDEFRNGARAGEASGREMLRRLQVAAPHVAKPTADASLYFTEIYSVAIKRAVGAELG
jgi:hypothetical protein